MARRKFLKKLFRSLRGTDRGAASHKPAELKYVSHTEIFKHLLEAKGITSVIDVGAARGQFVQYLRDNLDSRQSRFNRTAPGRFLPSSAPCYRRREMVHHQPGAGRCRCHPADQYFRQSRRLVHPADAGPNGPTARNAAYIGRVDVQVRRLDSVPGLRAAAIDRCLLKIDAQGYEHRILLGAEDTLHAFSLLYLESSLVPLYQGELLIEEMIAYLRSTGFIPVEIGPGFRDRHSREQLQANILFAKAE